MYKAMLAVLVLPLLSMMLLAGIVVEAHAAEPAPLSRGQGPAPRQVHVPDGFLVAAPSDCCAGSGGPYEPVAEARQDVSDGARWRVSSDPRLERRLTPELRRPLNTITIRF